MNTPVAQPIQEALEGIRPEERSAGIRRMVPQKDRPEIVDSEQPVDIANEASSLQDLTIAFLNDLGPFAKLNDDGTGVGPGPIHEEEERLRRLEQLDIETENRPRPALFIPNHPRGGGQRQP